MDTQPQDSWWVGPQPPEGLVQGLASVPAWQFAKILVPLTAVFLITFVLEYRAEVGADRTRLLTHEASVVQDSVSRVEGGLEIATGDLSYVVDLVASVVEDDTPERLGALQRSTLAFLRHRPSYFQVRFIDAAGQEVLRAESIPSGARITPPGELQNKSGRSYFSDTMRLEAGEVFVSPMELNVERGVVEGPYRPVVRLATPIDAAGGERRGIVILNAHAGHFMRAFEPEKNDTQVQRMIVNSDGYWVRHQREAEGGVVVPEHGRSFQRTFPEVWTQVLAMPRRWLETTEGLVYSDTVEPPAAASDPRGEAHELPTWMYISFVPRQLLDDIAVQAATPLLMIAAPLYFVLLAIGALFASAVNRRKLADEAVRSLGQLKHAMMNAALDAIVVMDEKGTTLEFNPAAQQIFGYTLEEARGKLVADLIIPAAYRETHRLGLEHYLQTGEGRIIGKHVDEISGIRKGGEEFPVELTVCPVMVAGKQFFYGFLRDLSDSGRRKVAVEPPAASRA